MSMVPFVIVIRDRDRFMSIECPREARCRRFDKAWIFGEVNTRQSEELWQSVAPQLSMLPAEKVHRTGSPLRFESTPPDKEGTSVLYDEFATFREGVSFALNEFGGPTLRAEVPTGLPVELKTGLKATQSEVGT